MSFAVIAGFLCLANAVQAEITDVNLVSIKAHASTERLNVCMVVKAEGSIMGDCNDPKCSTGGDSVDTTLAAKGMKRICKTKGASVNRGFDVTYQINGVKYVAWTARDPERELNLIGLSQFEDYSPLNPACARMTFKEASARSECTQLK